MLFARKRVRGHAGWARLRDDRHARPRSLRRPGPCAWPGALVARLTGHARGYCCYRSARPSTA